MQQFILLAPLPLLRLFLAARSHALQRTPCCGDASEGCWGSAVSDPTRTDTEYTRRRGRTVTGMSDSSAAHKGGFDSQRMGDRQCCRLRRGGTIEMDSIDWIGLEEWGSEGVRMRHSEGVRMQT